MTPERCDFHRTATGYTNVGIRCLKPAVDVWDAGDVFGPRPRCKRHMTVERKRLERRLAPHVHKAWASTVLVRADGSIFRTCADCGTPF